MMPPSTTRTSSSSFFTRYLLIAVLLYTGSLVPSVVTQIAGQYRICVPDVLFAICQQMVNEASSQGGRFECVPGNDKIDCIGRVTKGEADIVVLEPEEIYVAHRFFHDAFYVATEIRTQSRAAGSFRYEPVAVVRNSAQIKSLQDLRGKKSCHTGFARTSGWEVPLARLMQKNIMVRDCSVDLTTIEREVSSAYIFFGDSCIPGSWAPDSKTDGEYKQRYSKLCALCQNPQQCKEDDQFSGFRGSLRCLTENGGDIAWTKLDTVYRFFSDQTPLQQQRNSGQNSGRNNNNNNNNNRDRGFSLSASEYSFLCPDGTTRPINTNVPCTWAGRPWRSYLVTNRLSAASTIADIQQQITLHRTIGSSILSGVQPPPAISWLGDILEFGADEVEFHVPTSVAATVTPLAYLDRGNYTMTIEKPSCPSRRTVRICVRNEIEKLKCKGLLMASYGRRIAPYFECIQGEGKEDCMRKITTGQADVLSVDAREAYVGSKRLRLTPILSEAERFGDDETDASRYAVAVVRADAGVQSIVDLRGKRSCHGSVSSLTGWNIPLIVLRDSGLIYPTRCQFGRALAGIFSGGSCVPGAKDPNLNLPETLCSLCVGSNLDAPGLANEQSFCADNESEGFYGDLGAFRCLATFQGDVAFIDHLTPLLNTDGYANATWATGLVSPNFRLVCPFGPTRAITEFRQCHWGRIPTDKVITTEDKDYVEREDIRLTLLKASQTFHTEQVLLRLFGPYYGITNLLFKDTSIGLISLNEDGSESRRIDQYGRYVNSNKDIVYDKQYANRIIRDVDDCDNGGSTGIPNPSILMILFSSLIAVFCCYRREL